jgi:cobalt-zinc-cadmium resistance protein CzcA
MFEKIISFSIKNKLIVGIMTLLLVACCVYSAVTLPLDAQYAISLILNPCLV